MYPVLVEHAEALALIRDARPEAGGVWADLGAGSGVFTRALAELLGPEGRVYALDRRPQRLGPRPGAASIVVEQADFTEPLPYADLDGLLMANALHFVRRQQQVLGQLAASLKPGGKFVLVEYDLERGSPWVPFPVSFRRFAALAGSAGLSAPLELGRRASRYGPRDIYAALAQKPRAGNAGGRLEP